MIHIRQKHITGCGVACMAMIWGITYRQALKRIYPKHRFWQKVQPFPIGSVLWHFGFDYHEAVSNRVMVKQITHPAIIIVEWEPEDHLQFPFPEPKTHAIVWDPATQSILDPALKYAAPLSYYQPRIIGYYEVLGMRS